jgi:ribosomal protein S6
MYEIGFHLVPTIPEDSVAKEVDIIKALVTKEGGTFISEGFPTLQNLAYAISKTVKAQKSKYSKAYFGWVKFSVSPEGILNVKRALESSDVILRYLIISTVKESTLYSEKEVRQPKVEENIDKTIDELVIN